jgi:hypothetical protein
MRTRLASAALVLAAVAFPTRLFAAEGSPEALALATKEIAATGGASWEKARYFRFDFLVDFPERKAGPFAHYWDRWTGSYRVDVPGDDGYSAYFNLNDPKNAGKAVILRKGNRLTGEDAAKVLAKAYGRFINDSYWLLAPLKVLDPGVKLEDGGTATFDGKDAHVLKLSFSGVGLTPGDAYRHYVDPATGALLGWEYVLESKQEGKWKWVDIADFAGLKLSTRKVTEDGSRTIKFENVSVSATVDAGALKPPVP